MLVLQRDMEFRNDDSKSKGRSSDNNQDSSKRASAADILTIMSQLILIGSTAIIVYSALFPTKVSAMLEEYKERLTARRHNSMLNFMSTERRYIVGDLTQVFGDANDNDGNFKKSLMFADQIYHDEVADDARALLLQSPVLRYGVITGPSGSGKSRLIRSLIRESTYFAFLSFGLTASVKTIVDELSEEIGYDFDDWTERMLQGYFFKASAPTVTPNLEKLAFLLDELEEACWTLKFSKKTGRDGKRPVIVLDDLDSLNLQDPEINAALCMLFSAANKFAKEDTALFVFTLSDKLFDRIVADNIISSDVIQTAQVYNVGDLSDSSATRFLNDRLGLSPRGGAPPESVSAQTLRDVALIKSTVGTRIFDLLRVSEEIVKTSSSTKSTTTPAAVTATTSPAAAAAHQIHANIDSVLTREVAMAKNSVAHALAHVAERIGDRKMPVLISILDRISAERAFNDEAAIRVSGRGMLWNHAGHSKVLVEARRAGLDVAFKLLKEYDIVNHDGSFATELMRNGYREHRELPRILFSLEERKGGWFW
ncbi:hypothetical protein HDU83_009448 [Entophlyctis luteolus]|nr:hypothetical protein HDU83_009448 [Entophlyctis luteolus]KAJ3386752.1 hypothetical protein HDU84_001311 [Entophlyctis sp. JEL0112]